MIDAYQVEFNGEMPHFDAFGWNYYYEYKPNGLENFLTDRHNEAQSKYNGYFQYRIPPQVDKRGIRGQATRFLKSGGKK